VIDNKVRTGSERKGSELSSEERKDASDWRQVASRVSNWGRWGRDDELGALNLVGPAEILRAVQAVHSGQVISLSLPLDAYGIHGRNGFRRNPIHVMVFDGGSAQAGPYLREAEGPTERMVGEMMTGDFRFAEDMLILPLQAGTQWDGIAHAFYDDHLYNGHPSATVSSLGALKCGIQFPAMHGIVGRGVLVDVARAQGVDYLPPDFPVPAQMLDEILTATNTDLLPGDFLVVRTGWVEKYLDDGDSRNFQLHYAGLTWECAEWAREHDLAGIAADNNGVEVRGNVNRLLHMLAIRDMGMMLGELWSLGSLADACAEDHRYEFFLSATPLRVTGGVASPVNPVAVR
jgi:kynurenine formamidase